MNKILVITDPEAGWDCVQSAFKTLDALKTAYEVPEHIKTVDGVEHYLNTLTRQLVIHEIELR